MSSEGVEASHSLPLVATLPLSEKERHWQQLEDKFSSTTDRLGHGIDHGIFDAVVGLNAFDINTTGSCEGHLNWGTGAPYIDVEAPEAYKLREKLRGMSDTPRDQLKTIADPREQLREEITRINLNERRKLMSLLGEFYAERVVPYEVRLQVQCMALGWSRIESQGTEFQKIASEQEKQENLMKFQTEMHEFAQFLSEKFFSIS